MASTVADMSSLPVPNPFFIAEPIIFIPVWQSELISTLRVLDRSPCWIFSLWRYMSMPNSSVCVISHCGGVAMPHRPCPILSRVCLAVSLLQLLGMFRLTMLRAVGPTHIPIEVMRESPLPLAEASIAPASVNLM